MAKKKEEKFETAEIIENVENITSKIETFIYNNAKLLGGGFSVFLFVAICYFAYIKFYVNPNEEAVFEKSYTADNYFEKDSVNKAYDGKGYLGYKQLVERYGNTPGGKIASFKAGLALYEMEQYNEAINYFMGFSSDDELFNALSIGAIGDCHMQLEDVENAVKYYKKAIEVSKFEVTTEYFYRKLIISHLNTKEYDLAYSQLKKLFTRVPTAEYKPEFQKLKYMIKFHLDGNA